MLIGVDYNHVLEGPDNQLHIYNRTLAAELYLQVAFASGEPF